MLKILDIYGTKGKSLLFFCMFLFCLLLCNAHAADGADPDPADISVTFDFAREVDAIVAAVRLALPQGYHSYAHQSGEAGRPTVLTMRVNDAEELPVWYPAGALQRDYFDPQLSVAVYEGPVTLFVRMPVRSAGQSYRAELSLLLCSSRHCLPVDTVYSGRIPDVLPAIEETPWLDDWLLHTAKKRIVQTSVEESQGVLPPPANFTLHLQPRYADASAEISSLGKALLLGLLAGLLLNAMPCVLPVLTLKISGLLLLGGGQEGVRRFREHNICFAAGVMTLFTALALLLGLADLMWGQLYQSQSLILVMLLLVFLMGLSMLGVFSLPVIDLKLGSDSKHPRVQAYMTGLVATFLATPCSGPLLGGVLAWAFTQPLFTLVTVFWAVGMGMALPYIVFSIWPAMARVLPRPGAWMQVFERLLGFFLLGTALYLLSILPAEKHIHVLSVLLLVSVGAWLWGRYCGLDTSGLRRRLAAAVGICLLAAAVGWLLRPVAPLPHWQAFSPESFTAALGRKAMLVEFTADWCPNCKFLESTVLSDERVREWQKRYDLTLVRVDLTSANAWAVRLLEALGSKSIPLTALFPAGEGASSPLVLRDVYSVTTLEQALEDTFGQP